MTPEEKFDEWYREWTVTEEKARQARDVRFQGGCRGQMMSVWMAGYEAAIVAVGAGDYGGAQ